MSLDQIKLNEEVIITKIIPSTMRRRLFDLGFLPGEEVKCVLISPFHDPKAYLINGNMIALRNIDARGVMVKYERD